MREHPRLIFGLFIGCICSIVLISCVGGCMATTDPLKPNGPKISPTQLQQETIAQQQQFDQKASDLNSERQSMLDDYNAQADQLKAKFQASATKLTGDTAAYNVAVGAFNQKLAVASADLKDQAARNEKLVELGGNVLQAAGSGTFGPMGMLGTTLLTGAMGGLVGVWRDSVAKTSTLQIKNQQIADLKTAPTTGTQSTLPVASAALVASNGAGGLVQSPAPDAPKLAA